MKKTKNLMLLVISMPIFFASCISSKTGSENVYINNMKRQFMLAGKLKKLHAGGETEDVKNLFKQLENTKCNLQIDHSDSSPLAPEELFNNKKNAVVIVGHLYKCGKCTKAHSSAASGFFANDSGVVVTNYHVIDNKKSFAMGVMTYDGEVYPVKKVLAASKKDDIAIIQVENAKKTPYLKIQPKVNVGSDVWVISHPSKRFYMFTEGMVSALFERNIKTENKIKTLQITADFGGGSSGAPVFNEDGEVVGIVSSTQSIQATKCKQGYAQMVMKNCVPAESIVKLFNKK